MYIMYTHTCTTCATGVCASSRLVPKMHFFDLFVLVCAGVMRLALASLKKRFVLCIVSYAIKTQINTYKYTYEYTHKYGNNYKYTH